MDDRERNEESERPRVKVTDKRRVHAEAGSEASGPARSPMVEPGGGPVLGTAEGLDEARVKLQEAEQKANEYREHLQRLQAEFDNYRKRVLKEQTRSLEMAAEPLVRRMLEVLDEFQLALMAAEQKPDFDRFLHGVELVYAKLTEILRGEGLEPIDAQGKPFDPLLHEALMQSGDADGEPLVGDVLRPGYTLKGRVIRPAGVKVVRN